jgi:hypothetical protein
MPWHYPCSAACYNPPPHPLYLLSGRVQLGAFPARYRSLAWRFLLRLPNNASAFADLVRAGPHAGWADLAARYPVADRRLMARLTTVVNALAHWSPVFGELPFLPALAFPFVKFFSSTGAEA